MKTQYSEQPNPIWLRRRDNKYVWVRLRNNIKQEDFEEEDGDGNIIIYPMWTANEVEVMLPLKLGNEQFVMEHFDAIFDSGDPVGAGRVNEDINLTAETLAASMDDIEIIAETVAEIMLDNE